MLEPTHQTALSQFKYLEGQVLLCDITYLLRRPALETGAYPHLFKQPFFDPVKVGFGKSRYQDLASAGARTRVGHSPDALYAKEDAKDMKDPGVDSSIHERGF